LLGGATRWVGAAGRGRATAGDVGIVQYPGLVSAGKCVEERVAIVHGRTLRRWGRAIAVDRVLQLQLVPCGVRDVPDGRDEPAGRDSGPREEGAGSG